MLNCRYCIQQLSYFQNNKNDVTTSVFVVSSIPRMMKKIQSSHFTLGNVLVWMKYWMCALNYDSSYGSVRLHLNSNETHNITQIYILYRIFFVFSHLRQSLNNNKKSHMHLASCHERVFMWKIWSNSNNS